MKKQVLTLVAGMMLGMALLSGGSAAANTILTAKPTTQTFFVNGQKVQFEAYVIHGNNFVKLRDIGKAVNFGVTYDAVANSVHIDPNARYQEEVTVSAQAAPTPSALTEESVRSTLLSLKERYPNNTSWPSPFRSTSGGPYGAAPSNCAGWATLCSDAAFGNLPWRKVVNPRWEDIKAGDLIRYDNVHGGHVIVVVSKTDDALTFTDSGTTQKAYWGGQCSRQWLEAQPGYTSYTRYPK